MIFHGVSMCNLTKTFKGQSNDGFKGKILFLKEIAIFKVWGAGNSIMVLSWKLLFIFVLNTNKIMNEKLRNALLFWKATKKIVIFLFHQR